MSKEYTLSDFTDIFDYSSGWFSDSCIGSLFYQIFNRLPSMKMVKYKIDRDFIKEIKEFYQQESAFDMFEHAYYNHYINEKENEEEEEPGSPIKDLYDCIVICKENLIIGYFDDSVKIIHSNISEEEVNHLNQICERHKKEADKFNNLFVVTYSHNYFSLKQSKINETFIQINRHYNDDFVPVAAEIENFLLEDNKSGLIILHGKQGTGKTTYIRHLINLGKKRMIYMSGDLVDKLSDPSFITFIRQQKNSIFIVEDCEELLSSRNGSNRMNAGLVNILNISDGLLSDALCIKFICTFNAPLKDIDEALLRKGRLAARYEFKDLTAEKVNQLIKEEGLDIPEQKKSMTLAEIYNYEGMDFSLGKTRVGF
ncbi:AAA family ATPase [uncultured Bacteroides sp.]|uniref:AAA family ATPase n=1 Tax=uncultured Bacteroides sp. TaxID=162156 RepID=UPI0025F9320B|nr:AAA family ATPase [uncultured Bacteroides sp.]